MSEHEIAYSNEVRLHEAKWTDKEGSTVTFQLPMKGMEGQRNPFEKWTKRRRGRAGTRFVMACLDKDVMQMVYKDEVMLAGWNDSQTHGHTVKFWLCADTMGHPFEGYERHSNEFHITLVELDDDQEVIDQKMRDKVEASSKRPSERVSYVAAMLCKNEGFWTWLGVKDEDEAKFEVYSRCKVESRAELDADPVKAELFHTEMRKPFLRWQESNL